MKEGHGIDWRIGWGRGGGHFDVGDNSKKLLGKRKKTFQQFLTFNRRLGSFFLDKTGVIKHANQGVSFHTEFRITSQNKTVFSLILF